jgi:AcrR family transcriptional regulator
MPSSGGDARAVRSRQALRAAALALAARKPAEDITVREICGEAAVHYATFFRHYPSREALLVDLAAEQIDRMVELSLPAYDRADSLTAVRALLAYVDDHRALWTGLMTGPTASAMRDELLRISHEVAVDQGAEDGWLPVELAVHCTVSLIFETLAWWLRREPGSVSVDVVAVRLDRLIAAVQQP